ncbi:MAG: hypothetical protein ACTSVD_06795 [Candidatus Thorarchaeota archaeon]
MPRAPDYDALNQLPLEDPVKVKFIELITEKGKFRKQERVWLGAVMKALLATGLYTVEKLAKITGRTKRFITKCIEEYEQSNSKIEIKIVEQPKPEVVKKAEEQTKLDHSTDDIVLREFRQKVKKVIGNIVDDEVKSMQKLYRIIKAYKTHAAQEGYEDVADWIVKVIDFYLKYKDSLKDLLVEAYTYKKLAQKLERAGIPVVGVSLIERIEKLAQEVRP